MSQVTKLNVRIFYLKYFFNFLMMVSHRYFFLKLSNRNKVKNCSAYFIVSEFKRWGLSNWFEKAPYTSVYNLKINWEKYQWLWNHLTMKNANKTAYKYPIWFNLYKIFYFFKIQLAPKWNVLSVLITTTCPFQVNFLFCLL